MRNSPRNICVFGHADLDGIVSAAIASAYLQTKHPDAHQVVRPVDFHQRDTWKDFSRLVHEEPEHLDEFELDQVPDGLAIVDFPATDWPSDRYLFFADHHQDTYSTAADPAQVESEYLQRTGKGEPVFYDPSFPSCAELLVDALERRYGWRPPSWAEEAVQDARVADTAGYASVEDAIRRDPESVGLYDAMVQRMTPGQFEVAVLSISSGRLPAREAILAAAPELVATVQQEAEEAVRAYRECARPAGESARFIDLTDRTDPPIKRVRFAEFQGEQTQYALQLLPISTQEGAAKVRGFIGRSPWTPGPPEGMSHPDSSRIATDFAGGGGHDYAAGFLVTAPTYAQAQQQARQIAQLMRPLLRPLPAGHPYAVRPTKEPSREAHDPKPAPSTSVPVR